MFCILGIAVTSLMQAGIPLRSAPIAEASKPKPAISFASVVAPALGSYQYNDEAMRRYGFAPVDTPFMLKYGLRGRMFFDRWVLGLTMLYGLGLHKAPKLSAVPTVSTEMSFGASGGWRTPFRALLVEVDGAFRSLSVTMGSEVQGGALVYLGPALGLRLTYIIAHESPFVAVSAGYSAHINLGKAHGNALWEEPFERPGTHTATLQLEFGFGRGFGRLR